MQVGRAERLEREGEQVLASLANVSQRLPLLSAASSSSSGPDGGQNADSVMGVLAFSPNAQSLLLQRHFAALEKSRGFLAGILRDYQELVRRLQTLATEFFDAQTLISSEEAIASDGGGGDDNSPAVASLRRLEWMEDVARMFQRELLRKQRLVEQLEYHDAARLAAVHKQWPSRSRWSNVSVDYGTFDAGAVVLTWMENLMICVSLCSRSRINTSTDCRSQVCRRWSRRRRLVRQEQQAESEEEEEEEEQGAVLIIQSQPLAMPARSRRSRHERDAAYCPRAVRRVLVREEAEQQLLLVAASTHTRGG